MSSAQGREGLEKELAELDETVTNAQARLDQLPFTEESEVLRDMAAGLLERLQGLNKKMNAALQSTEDADKVTSSEDTPEGGTEHGS